VIAHATPLEVPMTPPTRTPLHPEDYALLNVLFERPLSPSEAFQKAGLLRSGESLTLEQRMQLRRMHRVERTIRWVDWGAGTDATGKPVRLCGYVVTGVGEARWATLRAALGEGA